MKLLLALCLCACATPPKVSLEQPAKAPRAKDYVDALKKWTRHGQLQSDFDVALSVDATMLSPEFRSAFAERYIKLYRLSPVEAERKRAEIGSTGADEYVFHAETSTHSFDLNDLSSNKTVWRISLVDDKGREVVAREVRQDKKARDFQEAFYPYQNVFSKSWDIRLPRTLGDGTPLVGPDTKALTLRFAGPHGSVDLTWQLL
jgi:hypothetical protein